MEVNVWTYAFEPPGPAFSDSDDTKYNWNEISVSTVNLINYPEFHEVLGAIAYFTGPFTNTSTIYVNYKVYKNNIKFAEINDQVPPPPPGEHWNWYRIKFWSGHASWEIYGPATIRIEINLSGWVSGSATFYMNIVSPIEERINWEANVPGSDTHDFYLFSFYGVNTNNTIGGFQTTEGTYKVVNTPDIWSRYDYLTTQSVSKNDCLTIIAESYDGSTISGIYDAWIQNSVI